MELLFEYGIFGIFIVFMIFGTTFMMAWKLITKSKSDYAIILSYGFFYFFLIFMTSGGIVNSHILFSYCGAINAIYFLNKHKVYEKM
jgi:O-antigen ligase